MEKLVVAILKSEHNVKLKKALVDKLLVNETARPSAGFNMKDFLFELERLWSIGAIGLDALSDTTGYETGKQLFVKKKAKYESFKEHSAILSSVLKYLFKSCDNSIAGQLCQETHEEEDWCQHLVNLIKLYFLPNLNRIQFGQLVKYNLITLIAYLRLVIDAFNETIGSLQTRVNLMNILATINTSFYQSYASSIEATAVVAMETDEDAAAGSSRDVNFLYLVQNDCKFGAEYLGFLSSFVALVDWFFQYSSLDPHSLLSDDKIDFNAIKVFIEETVKDTLKLIVISVSRRHVNQLDSSSDPTAFSQDSEWLSAFNAKESFENLVKSALLLRILSSKSDKLYKHALTSLVEVLMTSVDSENEKDAKSKTINENVVQLLSAFELKKANFVLINFFHVRTSCPRAVSWFT